MKKFAAFLAVILLCTAGQVHAQAIVRDAYTGSDGKSLIIVDLAHPFPVQDESAGAPNDITHPTFIANAEAADVTGTFTNATQTTAVANPAADGYATGLISIHGTYGAATAAFSVSDDGGTTNYPVLCARSDGSGTETGYTNLTNVSREWVCPVSGNDTLTVTSSAVGSGTVNVRVGISAPTANSGVISGTVSVAPPTGQITATSGNVANGVVAATLAAAAGKTTYITGLHMASNGATVALPVDCTITGIVTGTQTFTYVYGTLNSYDTRDITFPTPMPANAQNTAIVASCPASGTGGTHASMNVEGFQF